MQHAYANRVVNYNYNQKFNVMCRCSIISLLHKQTTKTCLFILYAMALLAIRYSLSLITYQHVARCGVVWW
jgi:hypothetical protein